MLGLALTIYEDGMCSCGHPKHLCRHPSNDGWFEVKTDQCQARAATDRVTSVKGYKPEPGTALYTVYTRPESKPLPPFPIPQK